MLSRFIHRRKNLFFTKTLENVPLTQTVTLSLFEITAQYQGGINSLQL